MKRRSKLAIIGVATALPLLLLPVFPLSASPCTGQGCASLGLRARAVGTVSVLYVLAGTGPHFLSVHGTATDYASFFGLLMSRGLSPVSEEVGPDAFQASRKLILLSKESFSTWLYADSYQAFDDAMLVSADGTSICHGNWVTRTCASYDYVDNPHWYVSGSIIALYVGHNTTITSALASILGPQFAGS